MDTIGGMTKDELRRFIVNNILSDPGSFPLVPALPKNVNDGEGAAWDAASRSWQATGSRPMSTTWSRIQDITLSADQASFDFVGIPQYFRSLAIVWQGRSQKAAVTVDDMTVRYNNDSTAANYQSSRSFWNGSATATTEQLPGTLGGMLGARLPGATATANYVDGGQLLIPGYRSNFFKALDGRFAGAAGAATGNTHTGSHAGLWLSTAAVVQITVLPAGGNWMSGSSATLYGLG